MGDSSMECHNGGAEASVSMLKQRKDRRMRLEKVGSYKVGRTLGRGNFATVRMAYHETANSKVAMKIVDRRTLDAENMMKIEREIEILQALSHPYIIKLYEVIRTERFLYIITEYVGNGELFDMLMDKGRQTEDESRRLFQQIASAVVYCHAKGIVHRDLKAENLLLDKKGNIKLIDFGFSNYQKTGQLLSTWCGSPPYAAPELLLAQEYDGRMSDVWSLGVILYILVTAGFPFPGESVDKLKRAVLGDHLKIPFWVSVECADLIRKMLTVSPTKRCTMQNVVQHRWFACKMPDAIRDLINGLPDFARVVAPHPSVQLLSAKTNSSVNSGHTDPTVTIFMQQHTGWTEDQISEEVLSRNYFSPIFATYELLLTKLNEFKDAEGNSALILENDQTRRGSRGSILSGKANVEPELSATTIPAHHLAKLSLTTNPDYDSDESSASDLGGSANDDSSSMSPSTRFPQQQQQQQPIHSPQQQQQSRAQKQPTYATGGGGSYKARRRRCLQALQDQQHSATPSESGYASSHSRRHTLCASATTTPLNPLLSAAAQQFTVDTRAWANAAAAAALFATQLHRQNHQQQLQELHRQQQLQQAALNLVSLQNFPLDYARMMHVPNQERRASANEALLGLNNYAHLLAACSTMGISAVGCTPDANNHPLSTNATITSNPVGPGNSNMNSPTGGQFQAQRRSVEEEGESYLNQRGCSKRNTVHAGMSQAISGFYTSSSLQRHARTPYAKQNGGVCNIMGGSTGGGGAGGSCGGACGSERRSSWASTTSTAISGLNISAQQQAQLEMLYRQSIGSPGGAGTSAVGASARTNSGSMGGVNFHPSESMTGVQQLQMEFQKLCASTTPKESTAMSSSHGNTVSLSSSFNVINSLLDGHIKAPTISITDENNQSLISPTSSAYNPLAFLASNSQQTQKIGSSFSGGASSTSSRTTQQPPVQQRPATVIGFSSSSSAGVVPPSVTMTGSTAGGSGSPLPPQIAGGGSPKGVVKFVYVPVSIIVALERLERFVNTKANGLRYEAQPTTAEDGTENEAMQIRVTPDDGKTILELTLFRMPQSPNISKAIFTLVQGEIVDYEQLRSGLLSVFNEVY